jgi:hypothetical protein
MFLVAALPRCAHLWRILAFLRASVVRFLLFNSGLIAAGVVEPECSSGLFPCSLRPYSVHSNYDHEETAKMLVCCRHLLRRNGFCPGAAEFLRQQ